ncbi:MAG: fibronectin type III domain-containing protein [Chlorobiota bacterium]|nr:fibronectin type III domain-containing protein [Chlorobiota bacterium]QQS66309.1 MAG: fibronectin type III domain-containing protein [Chlorobiota bacterium]
MKIKNTILSVLITVLASGMFFAACNENPIDPGTSGAPSVPTGLMAVSKSASVVSLKWSSTSDTGVVTYKISWKSAVDSGATTATSTTADATNLKAGEYVFSVVAVRNGISSSAASIMWAGATRYSNDAGSTGETIKIYEFSSSKGSAITLDPSKQGPKNQSTKVTNPKIGDVQFGAYISGTSDFQIGVAKMLSQFQGTSSFDSNVVASDSIYASTGLDSWFMDKDLSKLTYSKKVYTLNQMQTGGRVFVVRTGATSGDQHYAKIYVKPDASGNLVQGSAPERYVELVISYQGEKNLPYAKR